MSRKLTYDTYLFTAAMLIIVLAAFLGKREDRINELASTLLPMTCILAVFGGLIVLEDFGTATTIVLVAAAMIFAAGISWTRVAAFSLMLIPAAAMLIFS